MCGDEEKKVERFIRGLKLTLVEIRVSHRHNTALRDKSDVTFVFLYFAISSQAEKTLQFATEAT